MAIECVSALAAKRVLILTEDGGGGHIAASRAVEEVLKKDGYETQVLKPLLNVPGTKLFNRYFQEGRWNQMFMLTLMQQPLELVAPLTPIRTLLKHEMDNYKPDLIISVFPVANRMTYALAKKRKIPMLVLPTDLEAGHFFNGIKSPGPDFKVGLAFDDEELKRPLRHHLGDENFVITGFPLRSQFGIRTEALAESAAGIRKELGIAAEDKMALIMMGAQGAGQIILEYVSTLLHAGPRVVGGKLHVIALCGKNEALLKNVNELASGAMKTNIQVHALGFKDAQYMATLMRMSDVLISKPGGATVNEAIASEIPTLFHRPEVLFTWEAGNMQYAHKLGIGEGVNKDGFIEQLENTLSRKRPRVDACPGRDFGKGLLQTVHQMVGINKVVSKQDF